jgi:tetratricopeptide (TPR) repeat protein
MDKSQYAAAAALGAYAMQRKDYDEAIGYWDQALAISPGLVLVRLNLATALVQKGQTDRARAVLQKALEFQPTFQEARNMLDRMGSR